MHSEASDLPVRWTAWHSAADRDDLLGNVRRWTTMTWRRQPPCAQCGWPFPEYHLCSAPQDPALKSTTDE
jgi:hypothetical protein